MANVYRSICVEIDDLLLKIMRLSEQLIECKLEVETVMNNGFVNIAKARYIMGSKCVSTLQLPTKQSNPIHPLATVCRTKCDGFWVFEQQRSKVSLPTSNEKVLKEKIGGDTTRTNVKDLLGESAKGIRKRKCVSSVDDSNCDTNYEVQSEASSTDLSNVTASLAGFSDPIRLFGVLVPNTLRMAQKDFQEVIKVLMRCATLQSETNQALNRYKHLMEVKNLILKTAKNNEFHLNDEREYLTQSDESSQVFNNMSDVDPELVELDMQMKGEKPEPERTEEKLKFDTEELIGSIKKFEIVGSSTEFIYKGNKGESEKDSKDN